MEKYTYRITAVLRRRGVSLNDTGDIVQDAFIRLWEKRETIKTTNVFSWLCTTALHRSSEVHKKMRRFECISDDRMFDNLMHPEEVIVPDKNRIPVLRAAINNLKDPHKTMILMQLAGKSYQDMATHFGRPMGTIMSRLSRARDMLRGEYNSIYKSLCD